jgi:hypothetical protein
MTSMMKLAMLTVLAANWVLAQQQPPALLADALRRLPGVGLLDPTRDLHDGHTIQQLRDLGYWPPWVVADLDHDGKPDVVAAVVRRAAQGTQFGVLAIHAHAPTQIQWVQRLDNHIIIGVTVDKPDRVAPLYCTECDSNPWFRWSGTSYELELYAVGESIPIAAFPSRQTLGVFSSPNLGAKTVVTVESCTGGKVLDVRGTSRETRWYYVEVELPKPARGWIPASFAIGSQCIG